MIFSVVTCCVGSFFLKETNLIFGAVGIFLGLIFHLLALKMLLGRRESGDDKASCYYWKIRDVYNFKLFYHNLRVELFYQETEHKKISSKNAAKTNKENMDLILEFSIIDNKKSNIENWRLCQNCKEDMEMKKSKSKNMLKNSFSTAETGLDGEKTLRSEKISPEGEEREQKKGILDILIPRTELLKK